MATSGFSFYSESEYYLELARRVARAGAGDHICLATMTFEQHKPEIQAIFEALYAASAAGAEVTLLVDAFPFLLEHGAIPGPLMYSAKLRERLPRPAQARLDALMKLARCGGRYVILNQPGRRFTNPFAGRSHIKFAIINDQIFLGGVNLDADHHLDLMAQWDDERTASRLMAWAAEVAATGSVTGAMRGQDASYSVEPATKLLIDAGVPGQSLIMEEALWLIDEAREKILFTCQYFPNSVTLRRLVAAHSRGVEVRLVYNHPRKHPSLPHIALHYGVREAHRWRVPREFLSHDTARDRRFLHAKLIATESGMILGSHNYVAAGVGFGTAEIALLSHDAGLARRARAAFEAQLTPA